MDDPWWHRAVIYQVYPRSFCDTTGNGVGDLPGITAHLDHLAWLGVDALWLSPVYRSPMDDFGYDVADHCDVDPLFGTLSDLDELILEAHRRDLRVILDYVGNHTSASHPWFREALRGRTDPRRDFYVWADPAPGGGPPNNWMAAWGDIPAWTLDEASGQYYLHSFLPSQPDLNWANPEVVAAMHAVARFWLDRGVDGFRFDVIHCIGKAPGLPDDPPEVAGLPHCVLNHRPETHPLVRDLRHLLAAYPHNPVLVGEAYLFDPALVAEYYGNGDGVDLAFNFAAMHAPWDATAWREQIATAEATLGPRGAWPTWVLSNHDAPRHLTRYGGSPAVARAAAVLLVCLRGTPFLFAGEEFGLTDADVPPGRVVDPGGRDGCRAPVPWKAAAGHGWAGAEPWLPWPPDAAVRNAEVATADPGSLAHLYRRVIALRHNTPALATGDQELLDGPPGVVLVRRWPPGGAMGGAPVVVAVNFTDGDVALDAPALGATMVAVSSREGAPVAAVPFPGSLAAHEAVVLVP